MKLNPIISNGAVFEQNRPIVIFGEATGKVTAEFSGEKCECIADGRFVLKFKPKPAGGPYEMKVCCGDECRTITDILIGKVIFLSGQSNPELPIWETYERDTRFEPNTNVRLFQPYKNVEMWDSTLAMSDKWLSLTPENCPDWTAIGLCTALYFHEKLGIPVGIIGGYKGASVIESFMSEETIGKFDIDRSKIMDDHFYPEFAEFNKNSFLYHEIIEKIIPYGISSVVWYQGESNRTEYEGTYYDKMLIAMVDDWRKKFENPKLPFVIIQINDFPEPCADCVRAIQIAQERAAAQIENCELVKIADMGEHEKIHPENKRDVSMRVCKALENLNF